MFNLNQEVANYLAVRNRNRAEQAAGEPLPALPQASAEPQPRWARLRAFLRRLTVRPARPRTRPVAGEVRPQRR